jgi:hypothetical protein
MALSLYDDPRFDNLTQHMIDSGYDALQAWARARRRRVTWDRDWWEAVALVWSAMSADAPVTPPIQSDLLDRLRNALNKCRRAMRTHATRSVGCHYDADWIFALAAADQAVDEFAGQRASTCAGYAFLLSNGNIDPQTFFFREEDAIHAFSTAGEHYAGVLPVRAIVQLVGEPDWIRTSIDSQPRIGPT